MAAAEIDDDAASVYCANYGILPRGDIRELGGLPAHDVMCAGFPCQPFSVAGLRAGELDNRAYGWREVVRLAGQSEPRAVIMENSPRLSKDATFPKLVSAFRSLGYHVHYQTLNASGFGVPQNRERLYIVCTKKPGYRFPQAPNTVVRLSDVLQADGAPPHIHDSALYVPDLKWCPDDLGRNRPVQIGTIGKGGQGNRIYHEGGHAVTQCATSGGRGRVTGLYYTGGGVRRLSVRESLRCQGFPETFTPHLVSSTAYFHNGNAVAVPVVAAIATNLDI